MIRAELSPAPVRTAPGKVSIRSPERLHIRDGGALSYGARQIWYRSWIQRMSGCGPTAASNLLWYLAATRPDECAALFDGDGTDRADMLRLMEDVWRYVTPGMRGVDKAPMLTDGAIRYAEVRGVALKSRVLDVTGQSSGRPSRDTLHAFLADAFEGDRPVAFLNLSNGAVRNLDNWHWVTLISVDGNGSAEMFDQGRRQLIDMALWLETTTGGGAFVTLMPVSEA
jgi:hypothetical protein